MVFKFQFSFALSRYLSCSFSQKISKHLLNLYFAEYESSFSKTTREAKKKKDEILISQNVPKGQSIIKYIK